ncbi:MAG: DNA repair protein RecN [Candidatus Marinimicrobia bacterium]|nr:DNA repair protein RecN [Candidatus Neomarinimicrobiota bacterium]MCF7839561.1 DNA repair protein RecN [Candidatus Neomarinimicrobiota bacterium]
MLKQLKIKNFAIVDEITVQFGTGFNVITGETGVGKSLLVDALNVVLGDRAYRELIREGSEFAWVEAEFSINPDQLKQGLAAGNGQFSVGEKLVLTREIRLQGSSKVWINGVAATVQQLKSLGELLVDLHGQHEHQYLLNEDHHIDFLDAYAETEAELEAVADAYKKLQALLARLRTIEMDQTQFREKQQLYQFQLKEIQDVDPRPDELEMLEQERRLLENAQRLNELAGEITALAPDATARIAKIQKQLEELRRFDDEAAGYLPEIDAAAVSLEEVAEWAEHFQAKTRADPARLETIHQRITQIQHLCQKYNRTLPELIRYQVEIGQWLKESQEEQPDKDALNRQIEDARRVYSAACRMLSEKRASAAREMNQQVVEKLKRLGIPHARFEVQLSREETPAGLVELGGQRFTGNERGMDRTAFWMQTNPGESLRPLVRVASGGEVSRMMLAIKATLSGRDRIGTVIFDEIDTGISGKIARIVGHELANLSRFHQILCITHLPQIASLADEHYRVEKVVQNGRAVTRVKPLSGDARVDEIAKLLGTGEATAASVESAREMLGAKS